MRGILHLSITEIEYKKAPGIVKFHGGKGFNKKAKRIKYRVPLNFKKLLKEDVSNNNK